MKIRLTRFTKYWLLLVFFPFLSIPLNPEWYASLFFTIDSILGFNITLFWGIPEVGFTFDPNFWLSNISYFSRINIVIWLLDIVVVLVLIVASISSSHTTIRLTGGTALVLFIIRMVLLLSETKLNILHFSHWIFLFALARETLPILRPNFSYKSDETNLEIAYETLRSHFTDEFDEITISKAFAPNFFVYEAYWGKGLVSLTSTPQGTHIEGTVEGKGSDTYKWVFGGMIAAFLFAIGMAQGAIVYSLGGWIGRTWAARHNANLKPGEREWNPNMNYVQMMGNSTIDNHSAFILAYLLGLAIALPILWFNARRGEKAKKRAEMRKTMGSRISKVSDKVAQPTN